MTDQERFTRAYIVAMLWSSTDDEGKPLDADFNVDDIAPETMVSIESDCAAFYVANSESWEDAHKYGSRDGSTESELAGHDFWLTRAGHGAGFWDGDWEEPAASRLTAACKDYSEQSPYVGDDGLIYLA